jgi:hypothetical protein
LRRAIALFGRLRVEGGRAGRVGLDAPALAVNRREIALADGIAARGGERQPFQRQPGVARDAEPFGETSADIVLRRRPWLRSSGPRAFQASA